VRDSRAPGVSRAEVDAHYLRGLNRVIDNDFAPGLLCVSFWERKDVSMVAYFQLQPAEAELQELADQYWEKAGEREQRLEKAAFEAGESIRNGDLTLANLEAIVRWKSERAVHVLIGNSNEKIRRVLAVAANPEAATDTAMRALLELNGVDIPLASAILSAIYPERYTVLDVRALEALGHARHDVRFYEEYLAFCKRLAESNIVKAQSDLPAPTPLRTLDRALWEWTRSHTG
jgi:hypothetical protein